MKSYHKLGHGTCPGKVNSGSSRLLAFMLLLSVFLSAAPVAHAQNQPVRLSSRTLTISRMFSELEKQTGLLFVYSDVDLNTAAEVTYPQASGTLGYFLNHFVKGRGLKYEITPNKYVVFSKVGQVERRKPTSRGV